MWNDAYLIGDPQIDQQHKQLIGTLEDLLKSAEDDQRLRKTCKHTVDFLKSYSVTHFKTEEDYMRAAGYADFAHHHKEHQGFIDTLHELELELIRSDYDIETVRKVSQFLTRWWLFHIMKEDKKLPPPQETT